MIKFKDLLGLILVTGVMILAYITLSLNQGKYLDEVEAALKNGDAMVLTQSTDSVALAEFFVRKGYYDEKDAAFIAGSIARPLNKGLSMENLGQLNKKEFRVSATDALERGGEMVRAMADKSLSDLGRTGESDFCYDSGIPDSLVAKGGDKSLNVIVRPDDGESVEGILIRLKEHYKDGTSAADSILAYAFTDRDGKASFSVPSGRYYSVLPIRTGFEYGASKGTRGGSDISSKAYTFKQKRHTIAPLDPLTFSSIKADTALMVRTPQQYRDSRFMVILSFIGAWWILILFLAFLDRKKGHKTDPVSLILLMILSGVCILAMLSIPNPLNDMSRGSEMITAVIAGVIAIGILSRLDFISFYNDRLRIAGGKVEFDFIGQFLRWLSRPFGEKIASLKVEGELSLGKTLRYYLGLLFSVICLPLELIASLVVRILPSGAKWPKGLGYLLIAAFFILLLTLFGVGPEGSDAKVNLSLPGLTFQPSELNKYLILLFMAAFFAKNAPRIQAFSEKLDATRLRGQIRTVVFLFVAIAAVLLLYLVLLSDMGPALVLLVTFILIYSVARKDFPELILGVATFAVMLLAPSWLGMSGRMTLVMAALWFVLWISFGAARKKLYESAIFMNLVLLVFISGPQILSTLGFSEADRLANRMAVVGDGVWDNDALGGDQVAGGLWALAQGGFTGQGLAKGNPSLVPAGHTDMILSSIGEQMGWAMLALVIISFAILIHRSLLLARRTAHPFAFYLAMGIAVITGVQLLVIAFGSIGVIPLTGVAVPFLSHGKTSLILNLAAFGVIASLSRYEPLAIQKRDIVKYDGMVVTASLSFMVAAILLLGFLFKYQVLDRDEILVRPAFVAGQRGERMQEYNPRIRLLVRKLDSGNIYDRNGLLLATSHEELSEAEFDALVRAGLDEKSLRAEFARNRQRYYPFGDHTLFMVGDENTSWLAYHKYSTYPRGFAVESQKSEYLKGFSTVKRDEKGDPVRRVVDSEVRVSPYLPSEKMTVTLEEKDYSRPEFVRMLKDGIDSDAVRQWNADYHKRNVYLTLDARLQMLLQNRMTEYLTPDKLRDISYNSPTGLYPTDKVRASVVVINPGTGELLASANYPLPSSEELRVNNTDYKVNDISQPARTERDMGTTLPSPPGSTGKIMTSIASLMKSPANKDLVYNVLSDERVHDSNGSEPVGPVSLMSAISKSSNCYYIHLLNDQDLYPQLDSVFRVVGVEPQFMGHRPHQPYYFYRSEFLSRDSFDSVIAEGRKAGLSRYSKHLDKLQKRVSGHENLRMNKISRWAWGQEMGATPLMMARVAGIIANDGVFVPTTYFRDTLGTGSRPLSEGDAVTLLPSASAYEIQAGMREEASSNARLASSGLNLGGKTGTPDITFNYKSKSRTRHDGWYICYMNASGGGRIALAVRLEWGRSSSRAKNMVADCILPALREAGYINY